MVDLRGEKVAVTGATGFLGRYIVQKLEEREAVPIGVVRRPDRVPELVERGVEMRRADLAEPDRLRQGFAGCRYVISNAALFDIRNRDWDQHEQTNILGTRNVLYAAKDAGVERVIHVSSIAVYKRRLWGNGVTDEDSPQLSRSDRNPFNAYYVSKALSEQAAWEIADEIGLPLTTIRPGPIYGAHDPNATAVLARAFGWPVIPLPVGLMLPFVFGGDVAEAAVRTLELPQTVGRAYNTAGESDTSLWRMESIWRSIGRGGARLRLPIPVPFRLQIDNSRAREELGWTTCSVSEGLGQTLTVQPQLLGDT